MTSVYGVTRYGATEQIKNAMKDRGVLVHDDELLGKAGLYLTELTFDALKEMFLGARKIMDWLTECAGTIAHSGHCVRWVTPMGLPVVQPYRQTGGARKIIKTVVMNVSLFSQHKMPVNVSRQKSAFPPNYVHSLDSTHLLLTAIEAELSGIAFASVHDSYWTLAAQVDTMSEMLRDKFVELHQQPLLHDLKAQFQREFPNLHFRDPPEKGKLNLELVRDSHYFFN